MSSDAKKVELLDEFPNKKLKEHLLKLDEVGEQNEEILIKLFAPKEIIEFNL